MSNLTNFLLICLSIICSSTIGARELCFDQQKTNIIDNFSIARQPSDVVIRLAESQDIDALIGFDRRVSFEFFKPLYLQYYSQFPNGQDPDYYLDAELREDLRIFNEVVINESNKQDQRLLVAWDNIENKPAGLLLYHKIDDQNMELDLLLVDSNYRRYGIGKRMIEQALQSFPGIKQCHVYPLQFGNDNTLAFYERVGFVNQGGGAGN